MVRILPGTGGCSIPATSCGGTARHNIGSRYTSGMVTHTESRRSRIMIGKVQVNRWEQLVACIIAMMAIANLQYAWTLFTIPLTHGLRATLSAVQIAFTLFVLTETWLVPFEGYLIDRMGARAVVTAGGLLVGISWIAAGLAHSLTGLYVAYALGGVGAGAVYGASIGTALKWFPDRRGLAAGATAGAYGIGTALTVIPIQRLIASSGYQTAFITWGIVQGVVVIAAAQFLRRPSADVSRVMSPARVAQSAVSFTPAQMVATGRF